MLEEIGEPDRAEAYVRDLLERKREDHGVRPPRVHDRGRPAGDDAQQLSKELGERPASTSLVRDLRGGREDRAGARRACTRTSTSTPASVLARSSASPTDLMTPMFAAARMAGWTAHIREQYEDNRMIRPESEYIGPRDQVWAPIESRGPSDRESEEAAREGLRDHDAGGGDRSAGRHARRGRAQDVGPADRVARS